jgi:two-component system, OmpR family, KDP operon response regulator KdpE
MPGAILLVEDEPHSRRILTQFLRAEGYEVADAENGTAAVKLICSSTFDAVITDLDLGCGVDGFYVLSCFEGRFPGKCKILVSGTLTDVKARCDSVGALFINKPLQLDGLLIKLESLLVRQPAKDDPTLASTMVVIDIHYEWRVNVRQHSIALRQRSENLQRRIQENGARYYIAQEKMRQLLRQV